MYATRLLSLLFYLMEEDQKYYPHWSHFGLGELKAIGRKNNKYNAAQLENERIRNLWPEAKLNAKPLGNEDVLIPDKADNLICHIARQGGCSQILTYNIKDFHSSKLKKFELKAIHPDKFLLNLLLNDEKHVEKIKSFESNEKLSDAFLIGFLEKIALPKYTAALKKRL